LVCPLYQISPQLLGVKKCTQQRLADLRHYSGHCKMSCSSASCSLVALLTSFEAIKLAVFLFSEKLGVIPFYWPEVMETLLT
jgi:hypothetical protein